MQVRFLEIAKLELDDAVNYYDSVLIGLGERFKSEVKQSVQHIANLPKAWAVELGDIRKYTMHKFPYKLLYVIQDDVIIIVAVAHQHRRPDYWIERIE